MTIHPDELRRFCAEVLVASGVPGDDAETIARILVRADLEGVGTHGVSRLPVYSTCLRRGRINPRPVIQCIQKAPSLGLVDGGHGLGFLVANQAMAFALELASQTGAGFVAVRHSSHFGAASFFCNLAADAGKIGMAFTNTPSGVAPWGGRAAFFGTNPIAMSFPGRDGRHVCIDLSTSVTARGRILKAARNGEPIPEGWAVDSQGRPTTDAAQALAGAMLPMAGAKGYALALGVEILAGVLTGAAVGRHLGWMYDDNPDPVDTGHAFLAVDVAPLMDLGLFQDRLEALLDEVRAVPLAQGFASIRIPGERARRLARENALGLPLEPAVAAELDALAGELGLAPLSSRASG